MVLRLWQKVIRLHRSQNVPACAPGGFPWRFLVQNNELSVNLIRFQTSLNSGVSFDRLAIHHHHRWTSCPSGITPGLLARARDVDEPTHRSFARPECNGRPCRRVEIRVAAVATGSLSAGGKRWR